MTRGRPPSVPGCFGSPPIRSLTPAAGLAPPTQALEDQEVPLEEDFAAQVADRLLLDQIEAYVSALDAQTQAIFRLRLYGERTFPEIAAALEVPEPAVKAKYYRLMGRLRKEFDPRD